MVNNMNLYFRKIKRTKKLLFGRSSTLTAELEAIFELNLFSERLYYAWFNSCCYIPPSNARDKVGPSFPGIGMFFFKRSCPGGREVGKSKYRLAQRLTGQQNGVEL